MSGTYFPISTPVEFSNNDVAVFLNTTSSTSKDTGAVVIEGGVGVEENVNVGGYKSFGGGYLFRTMDAGGTSVLNNGGAFEAVNFNLSNRLDTNLYTIQVGTGGGTRVQFDIGGDYRISYSVGIVKTGATRTVCETAIFTTNGTVEVVGSQSYIYLRNAATGKGSCSADVILTGVTVNDNIEIQVSVFDGNNCTTDPDGSRLLIEKI